MTKGRGKRQRRQAVAVPRTSSGGGDARGASRPDGLLMGQVRGGGGDQEGTPEKGTPEESGPGENPEEDTQEQGPGEQTPEEQTGWTAERVGSLLRELAYNPQRRWSKEEYEAVVEHVARAGFDPTHSRPLPVRVRRAAEAAEEIDPGTRAADNATAHYLDHVVAQREWPEGTDRSRYLADLAAIARDPQARFFIGFYGGLEGQQTAELQLTVLRRSKNLRGPEGANYVLLEYRVGLDRWVTGHQPKSSPSLKDILRRAGRNRLRMLPRPRQHKED